MKFLIDSKLTVSILISMILSFVVVAIFGIYFIFYYGSSMETRIKEEIKYHGNIVKHHICDVVSCSGVFYDGTLIDKNVIVYDYKTSYGVDYVLPSTLMKFGSIYMLSDFSFLIHVKTEDSPDEVYFFIDVNRFNNVFYVFYVVIFSILSTSFITIIGIIEKKEKIRHEFEVNKGKLALQFDNLMFYIENLNHEVNSPLFILSRKLKDIEKDSPQIDKQEFEIINNAIEQISAVMQRTREVKRINNSSDDKSIFDLIESTVLMISVMRAEHIICKTDPQLKNFYLDQEAISNGMFINVLTNHIKNSIEACADTLTSEFIRFSKNKIVFVLGDNGNGISDEARKKIFDRGFSTKGSKLTRGVGLSINRSILEGAGGYVKLTDKKPGTQFEIMVPVKKKN